MWWYRLHGTPFSPYIGERLNELRTKLHHSLLKLVTEFPLISLKLSNKAYRLRGNPTSE